jgi:hypothetical protein
MIESLLVRNRVTDHGDVLQVIVPWYGVNHLFEMSRDVMASIEDFHNISILHTLSKIVGTIQDGFNPSLKYSDEFPEHRGFLKLRFDKLWWISSKQFQVMAQISYDYNSGDQTVIWTAPLEKL